MYSYWKKCIKLYSLSLYFNLKGEYKNCCYQKPEYYKKFSINQKWLLQWYLLEEIVWYMEKGQEHDACSYCYKMESLWIESPRQMYNNSYVDKYSYFPEKFTGIVKSIYIRFSNLCNLSCRMCGSFFSTKRRELDKILWEKYLSVTETIDRVSWLNYDNKMYTLIKKYLQK